MPEQANGYDPDAHADVYFSSRKTQHAYRQVLWRMTVSDAMRVCSSPETCFPGAWMMCWTIHELVDAKPICFTADDGRFDDLFDRLGVTVLMSRKMLEEGEAIMPKPVPAPKRVAVSQFVALPLFADLEVAS